MYIPYTGTGKCDQLNVYLHIFIGGLFSTPLFQRIFYLPVTNEMGKYYAEKTLQSCVGCII